MLFELKVHDDGDCAVCKIAQPPAQPTNTILKSRQDLTNYLTEVLSVRWPLESILDLIDSAETHEWVEFK